MKIIFIKITKKKKTKIGNFKIKNKQNKNIKQKRNTILESLISYFDNLGKEDFISY